jgi:uncharacterized C2H2 Zn-finger protein
MTISHCPRCAADLREEWVSGDGTRHEGSRVIGVKIRGVYDGVLFYLCPACDDTWNRWSEDHPLFAVAERHMAERKAAR